MTDYTHKKWDEATQTGKGFVRMGGNPGLRFVDVSTLTPEQIQMANNIEQNGYFIPPGEQVSKTRQDAQRASNGLKNFFGLFMGRDYMNAYPTGYAVPMNTQMPEVTQEPATVNDLVASVNANGSLYDYTPEGVQLPRDLDVLNRINPQTGRPYGRDLEEMQNPMTNAQNPEWTRRRVRDLININRIKQ